MSVPNGLLKLVFSGSMANGAEQWAFGLWFDGYTDIGGGGANSYDGASEPVSPSYQSFRANLLSMMPNTDSFDAIDSYYYTGGVAVQHGKATFTHAGTSTNAAHPTQVGLVLTLRTSLATRRGRGRIYLPARANNLTTGSLFVTAAPNAAVDSLATWFSSLVSAGITPVVVSQTGTLFTPITSVDCDAVPDIQRRRANRLTSPRHSTNV